MRNPVFLWTMKYLFYTWFFSHKMEMLMDDDKNEKSVLERILHSYWTFWEWMNNYTQAFESNFIWRWIKAALEPFNNPLVQDKDTALTSFLSLFSQLWRDFMREWAGAEMIIRSLTALWDWTINDWAAFWLKEWRNSFWKSATWFNRYFAQQLDAQLDKKNIPISQWDWFSMLIWKHLNDISQIKQFEQGLNSVAFFKESVGSWIKNQALYNVPFLRAITKWVADIDLDSKYIWLKKIINAMDEDHLHVEFIDQWRLPLERSDDKKLQAQRYNQIVNSVGKSSLSTFTSNIFDNIWSDVLQRNNKDITEQKIYDQYKPIADLLLKSKLSNEELNKATKLFENKDINWTSAFQFLTYLNHKSPGAWAIVLWQVADKLQYNYAKQLWYTSFAKLPDDKKTLINERIVWLVSPYIADVNLPLYTTLLQEYMAINPKYEWIKDLFNYWSLKWDLENSFRAWVWAATKWVEENDPEKFYIWTDIASIINKIEDPSVAMQTIWMVSDMIKASPQLSDQTKTNIAIWLFDQSKKFLETAMKDEKFMEKHSNEIQKMMEHYFGTVNDVQLIMDRVTWEKSYNKATGDLASMLFGSSWYSSSVYKKSIPYYNKLRKYWDNNYVKDFILKNYNGYSSGNYNSKYPKSYRDFVRAITQLDYKQSPAKAYSNRMIKELRDPQEQWLPGWVFSKSAWRIKPYRVWTKSA